MKRCIGRMSDGRRCPNEARPGGSYCEVHWRFLLGSSRRLVKKKAAPKARRPGKMTSYRRKK